MQGPAQSNSWEAARATARLRLLRIALLLAVFSVLPLVLASQSGAAILSPWGADLSAATPTLDTANGSYGNSVAPTQRAIIPQNHDGSDLTVWNTSDSAKAPQGGQVRQINIKGCAVENTSVPNPPGQNSAGTPVNTVDFQVLTPQADGSYVASATAPNFQLPFCSNSANPKDPSAAVNTSTITSFQPIHMCINQGQTVSFYDIGGFIPALNGSGPWYPQGVPFMILAPASGSSTASFADADVANGTYRPGETIAGRPNSGWGAEPGQEVMLQVIEGVGGDAYGLCPGGTANEPQDSNTVLCVYGPPTDGHTSCNGGGSGGSGGTPKPSTSPPKLGGVIVRQQSLRKVTISYTDSKAAAATVRIFAIQPGVRRGPRCLKPPRKPPTHARGCKRLVAVASRTHQDVAGRNSVVLTTPKLTPGSYEVEVSATLAGQSAIPVDKSFRVRKL